MSIALIVTLGTRDLQITRENLSKLSKPEEADTCYDNKEQIIPRRLGELLNKYRDSVKKEWISLPIIEPALEFLRRAGQPPGTIILVVTDQDETVGEGFRQKDTIEFGKFLEWFLIRRLNQLFGSFQFNVTIKAVRENIVYLDKMIELFRRDFERKPFSKLQEMNKIYLLNQGGIDAINNALLFQGIARWGTKMTVLSVDERIGTCVDLTIVQQMTSDYNRRIAGSFVRNFQYAALSMLESLPPAVNLIAEYAESRLHFDFENCRKVLTEIRKCSDLGNFYESHIEFVKRIEDDKYPERLRELYINARLKYHQKGYVDFLLRFFRISEELVRHKATEKLGIRFDNAKWNTEIDKVLKKPEFSELARYLQDCKIDNVSLDYHKTSTTTFLEINRAMGEEKIVSLFEKLQPLKSLRNKSIGGHDFSPVSLGAIKTALKGDTTLEQLFAELEEFLEVPAQDPFEEINLALIRLIDKVS